MKHSNYLYIFRPADISLPLQQMLTAATEGYSCITIYPGAELPSLKNQRILIAVELNTAGYCIPVLEFISTLHEAGDSCLEGAAASILIHSPNELNTKSAAADIIFQLNQLGCSFPGHPLVEATASLANFRTWQKTMDMSLLDICLLICRKLSERLMSFTKKNLIRPNILALHSSYHNTSNTLYMWNMLKERLTFAEMAELHVENGKVQDCIGCTFKTCIYFSKQSSCFYGGIMVEEIYPAIEKADAVIWLCPNYNDSVSANLTAVINRLTALYRKTSFNDKALFGVIVSGNSGSDSVAMQLIDALCINKGFYLPPYFALMATANDPLAIKYIHDISSKVNEYADSISKILVK